jgi:hypothetical protein
LQAPWTPPLKDVLDTSFIGEEKDEGEIEIPAYKMKKSHGERWDADF